MSEGVRVHGLPPMTIDEFLNWEVAQEDRFEFIDGVVYAMSGGSLLHNTIVGNVFAHLWGGAGVGPCRVYQEAAKLSGQKNIFYPDVIVVCRSDGADEYIVYRPCLLVEVLSRSTTHVDRGRKLAVYQSLPSLRAYLIVRQDYQYVERHWRESADAPWQRQDLTPADGGVPVPCPIEGALPFPLIYRGTTVPERSPLRRVKEEPAEEFAT